MTLEDCHRNINDLIRRLNTDVVPVLLVPNGNELLAKIKNRIVLDGRNSNGSKIGNYSTTSSYYTREQFDRKSSFNARGKNSRGNFKNGKQRSSMYFPDGYKGLRDSQGKPTGQKVLNYTGSTMAAYIQETTNDGIAQGFTTQLSSDIRKGHESRLAMDIYKPSQQELQEYNRGVVGSMEEFNLKILSGVSG